MNQEIKKLLEAALKYSVFISPNDPGLSYDEIVEIGKRAKYLPGEVGDAVANIGAPRQFGQLRVLPDATSWVFFFPENPEYRNFEAFDFVIQQLNERIRYDGANNAQLDRSIIVERALEKGIQRNDVELAITYQVMSRTLNEKNGVLRFVHNSGVRQLPSEQLQIHRRAQIPSNEVHQRAYLIVKDIVERRMDGRPQSVESLDAFAETLAKLGYGPFRLWWMQTVGELRRVDPHSAPVSASVLAAALVEGALTLVVKHARANNLAVFRSSTFERDPKAWKIDELVASAASGSDAAILDPQSKARAELLIRTRQRIHAGRMLSDYPAGVPDIRPEEARDAKATAELVVRRVLDWLQKFPPA